MVKYSGDLEQNYGMFIYIDFIINDELSAHPKNI